MSVLTWNGRKIPPELRKLPPGRYALYRVDRPRALTAGEEAGIEQGLRGKGIPAAKVLAEIDGRIQRAAAQRRKRRRK